MVLERYLNFAMEQVVAPRIHNHEIPKNHIDPRIGLKKIMYPIQRAGQVLFVTIQISQNLAAGPSQSPVHRIIHALVLFHKGLYALVRQQPIQRPIIRPGVLDDMFYLPSLIGHGSNAKLEPV